MAGEVSAQFGAGGAGYGVAEVLELVLHLERGRTPELARECLGRMRPAEFRLLLAFAGDLIQLAEAADPGQQTVVATVSRAEADSMLRELSRK